MFLFGEMDDILSKIFNLSSLIKWTSGKFHLVYLFNDFFFASLSFSGTELASVFFKLFNLLLFHSVSDVSDLKFLMICVDPQEFVCLF